MIETLKRCFKPLPSRLQRGWAAVAAVHAVAALTELVAAVALYAFLGGTTRAEWFHRIMAGLGVDPLLFGFGIVVLVLLAKSLLGGLGTWLRADVTAGSIQSAFTALVRSDLAREVRVEPEDQGSSRRIWRAMQVSDIAYRIVAAAGVSLFAESLAAAALVGAMVLVAPLPAVIASAAVGLVGATLLMATRGVTARIGGEAHKRLGDLASAMHSVFGVQREIRSKRREREFTETLSRVHGLRLPPLRRHLVLLMLPRHVVEICFVGILVAVVLLTQWTQGREEFIAILGVFAYSGFRLVPAANRILFSVDEIRHHDLAVAELEEAHAFDVPGPTRQTPPLGVIELRGVSHRYHGHEDEALSGIDLTIRRGERIGLIGESGSGKSTLMELLGGLVQPTSGRVTIGDLPAHEWLRDGGRLGLVPQGSLLLDTTIRENIDFGLRHEQVAIGEAIETVSLKDTIERFPEGENTTVGERGGRLSGGERQRVAIARAIVDHPELLLLDEATSALDQPTEQRVLSALAARPELTIVVAAHRLRSLSICDRVVVLERGHVVAEGTVAELSRHSAEFRRLTSERDRERPATLQESESSAP